MTCHQHTFALCRKSSHLELEFNFDNASFTQSANEYTLPASTSYVCVEIQAITSSCMSVSPLDNR